MSEGIRDEVFRELGRHPATTKEIADALGVELKTVGVIIKEMKRRGLAERCRQLPGGRHPWKLSRKGQELEKDRAAQRHAANHNASTMS